MGFVRIFWKNNVQEAYLPKMSISGQIVAEIVAQLCLENSIQTLEVSLVCFPALIIHGVQTKFQFNPRTDFICNIYKLFVEACVA